MILECSSGGSLLSTASSVYDEVLRTDFSGCGYALLQLDRESTSRSLRSSMVELWQAVRELLTHRRNRRLTIQSLARFDQQTTTKFHLDGGPEESILMLGYQPTSVRSAVALADYSHAAFDLGLTPNQFMEMHNPMFASSEKLLEPYVNRLSRFDESRFQILLINNSRSAIQSGSHSSLGVLHQPTILNPDAAASRIINSAMFGVFDLGTLDAVSSDEIAEFLQTDRVARKDYFRSETLSN